VTPTECRLIAEPRVGSAGAQAGAPIQARRIGQLQLIKGVERCIRRSCSRRAAGTVVLDAIIRGQHDRRHQDSAIAVPFRRAAIGAVKQWLYAVAVRGIVRLP
jgi:hypothetical protein